MRRAPSELVPRPFQGPLQQRSFSCRAGARGGPRWVHTTFKVLCYIAVSLDAPGPAGTEPYRRLCKPRSFSHRPSGMKYRRLWRGRVFVLRYQPVPAERGAFKDKLRRSAQHSLDNGPQRPAPFLTRKGAQSPESSIGPPMSAPHLRRQGREPPRISLHRRAPLRVSSRGDPMCIFFFLAQMQICTLGQSSERPDRCGRRIHLQGPRMHEMSEIRLRQKSGLGS